MSTRPIRVVMFAGGGTDHQSGGIGTFIRYLQDEWTRTNLPPQVRIVDTRGEGGTLAMACHFMRAMLIMIGLRLTGKVDIIHLHMSAYGSTLRKGILACLGSALGIPVIIHIHASNFRPFYAGLPIVGRRAIRFALNRARSVVVLGTGWRDYLISQVGVDPQKVTIIFNGVPAPSTPAAPVRPIGTRSHIAFLGQLGDRKGVPELVAALQLPQLRSRSWTATVAGDGEVSRFRDAVNAAGLAERVSVPGWLDRNAASTLLQNTDVFVLPSHFEAMPIAILEAMAHGVAVITTPVGAIPEFLTDGENALLVPPGDPERLANAIAQLLDAPEERARLAETGQRVFASAFHIQATAVRVLALYRSVLDQNASVATPGITKSALAPSARVDLTVDHR